MTSPYTTVPTKNRSDSVDPDWYKQFVGGKWQKIGKLQFDFLITAGLKKNNNLLDIGCGSLRGGINFIKYLNKNKYYGIDIRKDLLVAAQHEISINKLKNKKPTLRQITNYNYQILNQKFDFAIAVSVFTHLSLNEIIVCLFEVKKILKKEGCFFATYFESNKKDFKTSGLLQVEKPNKIITFPHQNPYHYYFPIIKRIAKLIGLKAKIVKKWKHPRNQKMLIFKYQ